MRSNAIAIYFDKEQVSDSTIESLKMVGYDIEFDSSLNEYVFYSHNLDGKFKRMERDLFSLLPAVYRVQNRATGTDHLDLFIEVSEVNEGEIIIDKEDKHYKNIRFSEIQNYDISKTILRSEL